MYFLDPKHNIYLVHNITVVMVSLNKYNTVVTQNIPLPPTEFEITGR